MMPRPPPRKLRSERVEGRRTFWALVLASGLFASLGVVHAWTRLQVLELNDDNARAVYGFDLLLLRPDLHVVWRGNAAPDDAVTIAATATGH